jgi:predicted nucleic acid-binding protein
MRLYVDTSALLKRYIQEAGSNSVHLELINQATEIIASVILVPELSGVLRRAVNDTRISEATAIAVIEEFQRNQRDFEWYAVDNDVRDAAATIGWATGSRGMVSIHVATAHIGLAEYFLTADKRQHQAAISAGMNSFLVES